MGDLQDFAAQICESIGKNTGRIAAVSDRDSIIALSGAPRRELVDRRNSADLENLMEQRKSYRYSPGNVKLRAVEGSEKYYLGAAAPIVAQGDLMGCVMLLMDEEETPPAEGDQKLVQTVAGFWEDKWKHNGTEPAANGSLQQALCICVTTWESASGAPRGQEPEEWILERSISSIFS